MSERKKAKVHEFTQVSALEVKVKRSSATLTYPETQSFSPVVELVYN